LLVFKLFKVTPWDLLTDSNSSINISIIMEFLSIDFSTNTGSLFIKTKNKTFMKILQSDKSHNDLLMKQILDFFAVNNLKFDDIAKIFVNQGPGNFSGLRTSLAIAKGISLSKNLKLFGYNTFLWSCAGFFKKRDTIFCLINFREKYYIKKFDRKLISILSVQEVKIDEIIKKFKNEFIVIPDNIKKQYDEKILKNNNINTVNLDHNKLEFLQIKGLLNESLIKPLYLS